MGQGPKSWKFIAVNREGPENLRSQYTGVGLAVDQASRILLVWVWNLLARPA